MNQQKIDQLTERILNETLSAISSSLLISNDYFGIPLTSNMSAARFTLGFIKG